MSDPYIVISVGRHAGLPTDAVPRLPREEVPPAVRRVPRRARDQRSRRSTGSGVRNKAFAEKWFDEHEEGLEGGWDAQRRNKELDDDGVTGEVIFPDADAVESRTCAPFGAGLGLSGDLDPELGLAGARAHNRWLAELCADTARAAQRRRPGADHAPTSTTCSPRSAAPRTPVSAR